jgi:hypothetical protein
MSSKRAVTRKREVVEVKKPVFRDPRFDNVAGPKPDENTLKNRYSFLNDYKESEMAELRAAIKKTKNEDEKEKLKRKLLSMESQKKARERKEKEQQIMQEHKKKEKELVKQGKQPFYLKKCTSEICASILRNMLTCIFSRAKEARTCRPLPEHERQRPREGDRAPAQEGGIERAEEYASRQTWCFFFLTRTFLDIQEHGFCRPPAAVAVSNDARGSPAWDWLQDYAHMYSLLLLVPWPVVRPLHTSAYPGREVPPPDQLEALCAASKSVFGLLRGSNMSSIGPFQASRSNIQHHPVPRSQFVLLVP